MLSLYSAFHLICKWLIYIIPHGLLFSRVSGIVMERKTIAEGIKKYFKQKDEMPEDNVSIQ